MDSCWYVCALVVHPCSAVALYSVGVLSRLAYHVVFVIIVNGRSLNEFFKWFKFLSLMSSSVSPILFNVMYCVVGDTEVLFLGSILWVTDRCKSLWFYEFCLLSSIVEDWLVFLRVPVCGHWGGNYGFFLFWIYYSCLVIIIRQNIICFTNCISQFSVAKYYQQLCEYVVICLVLDNVLSGYSVCDFIVYCKWYTTYC